jgi:LPS export ABC transporter protein LptC
MRRTGRPPLVSLWTTLLCATLAGGCGEQNGVPAPGSTGELPDQEVTDFVLTETDEGTPVWTLYARHAATYRARNIVVARGVRVDFFDEQGARTSELTAHEGEINERTRDMIARGDVVIQTTEGTRMTSQELRFLNRTQRIVSPVEQLVRVERGGDVLTGYGFESDPELEQFEFKRKVQATVRTRSGGLVEPGDGK